MVLIRLSSSSSTTYFFMNCYHVVLCIDLLHTLSMVELYDSLYCSLSVFTPYCSQGFPPSAGVFADWWTFFSIFHLSWFHLLRIVLSCRQGTADWQADYIRSLSSCFLFLWRSIISFRMSNVIQDLSSVFSFFKSTNLLLLLSLS